jgi:dUTP pyrophosphatase
MKTKIKLLDSKAVIPSRAHSDDTGYDITLIGIEKIVSDVIFFKTGISLQTEPGYYFEIVPRSSISKTSVMLANSIGIIDWAYTGELLIPLRVVGSSAGNPTSVKNVAEQILGKTPRVCQLILRKRLDSEFEVVEELTETIRGDGGFGSTDQVK